MEATYCLLYTAALLMYGKRTPLKNKHMGFDVL
jgi:hypothetical protein